MNWAYMQVRRNLPEPKRTELAGFIEVHGWRPVDGFEGCWYAWHGGIDQDELADQVRNLMEMAVCALEISGDISFLVHTGRSTPYVGSVNRRYTRRLRPPSGTKPSEPAHRRTRPLRTPHPLI